MTSTENSRRLGAASQSRMPPDFAPPRIGARHEPAGISGPHLVALLFLIASAVISLGLVVWAARHVGS
jgi:hypothetical protein